MNDIFDPQYISILDKYILKYIMEDLNLSKQKDDSLWLEFGVFSGKTINFISDYTKKNIYGFDSFEGLPEYWRKGFEKGAFNRKGQLPEVKNNVILIKGWFNETLEPFLEQYSQDISFVHLDADLYSSTKYVLNTITPKIRKNCIIVFDEIFNFPEYEDSTSELRALKEWVSEKNVKFEWIGICSEFNERAAIKITSIDNEF